MKTAVRWLTRSALAFVALLILYFAYISVVVWHASTLNQARPADAIVVLGAAQYNGSPSPVLRARLDHASTLWKQKLAPVIVVTGGRVPGDTHTEAGASAEYLGSLGVPDASVLREVEGRNTWQSLAAAARFMKGRNIHKVILVSDSFHDARIAAMAKSLGLDPLVSPATNSPITGTARVPYFAKEVVAVCVGKLFGFDRAASLQHSF